MVESNAGSVYTICVYFLFFRVDNKILMGSEGRAEYAACSSSELLITDPAKALFI
jgi:hypothetical protein